VGAIPLRFILPARNSLEKTAPLAAADVAVLVEQAERALLGLVATTGQVLQGLATGGLLPAAYNAAVLVLDQVGLGETAGGVLGISVKNRGFGANGGNISGHLILWIAIFYERASYLYLGPSS
jgi:hypothetical protein